MVLGTFFPQTTSYVEEKQEENFPCTGNAKMPNFTQKRQTAADKRRKWRKNHGNVVTFAFRVSRERDAKSLFCSQARNLRNVWTIFVQDCNFI